MVVEGGGDGWPAVPEEEAHYHQLLSAAAAASATVARVNITLPYGAPYRGL